MKEYMDCNIFQLSRQKNVWSLDDCLLKLPHELAKVIQSKLGFP